VAMQNPVVTDKNIYNAAFFVKKVMSIKKAINIIV
tara:strand:+ start:212 stop:316 length:105 start_codon:yes stop_codon:yes gene_type:complete